MEHRSMMSADTERPAMFVTGSAGIVAGVIAGLQSTVRVDAIIAVALILIVSGVIGIRILRAK